MNWGSPADFLAMGGYALYVWGSLGMCAAAVAVELAALAARRRAVGRDDAENDIVPDWNRSSHET